MKKILCLLLILILLPIGNVTADEIERTRIIMEEGTVGDTVKLYLIPPSDNDVYDGFIDFYYDKSVLEYIDYEFLNESGVRSQNLFVYTDRIGIVFESAKVKPICIMMYFKLKTDGDPSFYLYETYLDKNCNLITERSGNALWEPTEKGTGIPIYIEPPYSEIEIFIRDKYVLFAEEHAMNGTIWVAAYDEYGNLIDVASYTPSATIRTKPYSKASYAKIMWWDKRTLSPVCPSETIYFK